MCRFMQFNIIILDAANVRRSRVGSYGGSRWQGSRAAHPLRDHTEGPAMEDTMSLGHDSIWTTAVPMGPANCTCAVTASTCLSESTAANQGQIFLCDGCGHGEGDGQRVFQGIAT